MQSGLAMNYSLNCMRRWPNQNFITWAIYRTTYGDGKSSLDVLEERLCMSSDKNHAGRIQISDVYSHPRPCQSHDSNNAWETHFQNILFARCDVRNRRHGSSSGDISPNTPHDERHTICDCCVPVSQTREMHIYNSGCFVFRR